MQNQYPISSLSWPTVTPSGLIYLGHKKKILASGLYFQNKIAFFPTFLMLIRVVYNNHVNQNTYQCIQSIHYFPPELKTSFHHDNVLFDHQKGKSFISFCLPALAYWRVILGTPIFYAFSFCWYVHVSGQSKVLVSVQ